MPNGNALLADIAFLEAEHYHQAAEVDGNDLIVITAKDGC
jgi:hypothetical protein